MKLNELHESKLHLVKNANLNHPRKINSYSTKSDTWQVKYCCFVHLHFTGGSHQHHKSTIAIFYTAFLCARDTGVRNV